MRDLKNGELELNRIYHGDCFNFLPLLEKASINLIICDLPYQHTNLHWDVQLDLNKLWEFYHRIISESGCIILFAQQAFAHELVASNKKLFKYELIWEKSHNTNFLNAKKQPLRSHENILVFYKKSPTYNPQKTVGHAKKEVKASSRKTRTIEIWNKHDKAIDYSSTERYPRSVLYFASDRQKESLHPTQKPLALIEYLIKTYSNEGDVVLDSCMGSATTAVAAIKTNRRYIGMEKDENYFNISMERIQRIKQA
ncbi:DNA-methyltransferase [Rufibacter immobilis]|uniref:DNA-methyltransferase n=1 Tax=Rufibacter immobilis TaxID=1348778 RepID=UPI0035E73AA5